MRTDRLVNGMKWLLDGAAVPVFNLRPRPFSPGYQTVKRQIITSAIDRGMLRDGKNLPPGYGVAMDERVVEYPWLFAQLTSRFEDGATIAADCQGARPAQELTQGAERLRDIAQDASTVAEAIVELVGMSCPGAR